MFVGNNLFSTELIEEPITLKSVKPLYNKTHIILIELVADFSLDTLQSAKMEDHDIALGFINNIIKSSLRNSTL